MLLVVIISLVKSRLKEAKHRLCFSQNPTLSARLLYNIPLLKLSLEKLENPRRILNFLLPNEEKKRLLEVGGRIL